MPIVIGSPLPVSSATYCTIQEAKDAGATGTEDEIEAAIEAAEELIDAYTGDRFATTVMTVMGTYSNGQILLPVRLQSISTVRFVGHDTDVDTTAYRLRTSATLGDIDALEWIGGGSGYNGYRATVTGVFGYATTPWAVRRAAALIAAHLRKHPTGSPTAGIKAISVEGYTRQYGEGTTATTGVPEADELLRDYRTPVIA